MKEKRESFISELKVLCIKHNVSVFAGMFGLKFRLEDKDGNVDVGEYYTQDIKTKELIENK
jgi:hypothetical protein